jgi:hypothetical protein
MKYLLSTLFCLSLSGVVFGQTCTISCPGASPCTINWNNASPPVCDEGGNANTAGVTTLVISAGVTVDFGPGDTWTGSTVEVYGHLLVTGNNVVIDANIVIKNGGLLTVSGKLRIGQNTSGCGKTLVVESGGTVNVSDGGGGADDRLSICNKAVIISPTPGNSCNTYDPDADPPTPTPYCNPPGGFTGPIEFDEDGVQPVEMLYFHAKRAGSSIELKWATSKEEDFSHFVVQHAVNSLDFSDLDEIAGAGYNTESAIQYAYTHTLPLIGYNYYRLKAVDLNGSVEYFGPVVERYQGAKALWVHPNPASGEKIEFKINFSLNEGDRVQVYNQLGLLMADIPVKSNSGTVYFPEKLRTGAYILRYTSRHDTTHTRFIVVD